MRAGSGQSLDAKSLVGATLPLLRYAITDWTGGVVVHDSWAVAGSPPERPTGDIAAYLKHYLVQLKIGSITEFVSSAKSPFSLTGPTIVVIEVVGR